MEEKRNDTAPPDGGLMAWGSVIGGWIVTFCTFGFASSFGVFQDYYATVSTSSSSEISWIGSLQLFFLFGVGLPAGQLYDLGYFHYTSICGTILYVFCIFMLSIADPTKYYQLILSQGIGQGLGSGLLLVPALSIQAQHWRRRRSLAMGIALTGSSAGGIVYPIMLNQLFHSPVGFAWGVRAAGFLTLGLLVIANCIMTTRVPAMTATQRKNRPQLKHIVTDGAYMLAVFGFFLGLWGMFMPYFYLQLWTSLHGLSSTLAFYTIAILNAASIVGRTLPNLFADKSGQYNFLCPITFISGALIFVMLGATNTGAVIVFSILYGAFSGAFIALYPPTLASMATESNEVGLRIGVSYFLTSFALLTGTPIDGALLGPELRWDRPIIFSAVTYIAGAAVLTVARYWYTKRRGTQRI
ncbi:major facilitator superfamily domain-containing protein [Amylocystis lapponica]|nr:major facilitator superfamily domain-containing protein [Amylocystis lapponica]